MAGEQSHRIIKQAELVVGLLKLAVPSPLLIELSLERDGELPISLLGQLRLRLLTGHTQPLVPPPVGSTMLAHYRNLLNWSLQ
jgi:hypothetical protein